MLTVRAAATAIVIYVNCNKIFGVLSIYLGQKGQEEVVVDQQKGHDQGHNKENQSKELAEFRYFCKTFFFKYNPQISFFFHCNLGFEI